MEVIEQHLYNQTKQFIKQNFTFQNRSINTKVAVIVEPRNHKLLQSIVYNIMHSLGEEWNLHIFSYDIDFIRSLFPNCEFYLTLLNSNNLTANQYNKLFKSVEFWKKIEEETILIFQTDSFIMNPTININIFLEYPFIGGIYRYITTNQLKHQYKDIVAGYIHNFELKGIQLANSPKLDFSINGGFSLRKKSVMLDCLKRVTNNDIIEYRKQYNMDCTYLNKTPIPGEDVYFQNAIDLLGYKLPDKKTCISFCENLSYSKFNSKSFGIHNVKKDRLQYFKKEIVDKFTE